MNSVERLDVHPRIITALKKGEISVLQQCASVYMKLKQAIVMVEVSLCHDIKILILIHSSSIIIHNEYA